MKTAGMLGLAVIMALGAAGCKPKPQPPPPAPSPTLLQTADLFFDLLQADRVDDAYAMLAEDGRRETPPDTFRQRVTALGLVGHQGVVWDPPRLEEDSGILTGTVTTRNGSRLPQELVFLKQGADWRLQALREPPDPVTLALIEEARHQQPAPDGMTELAQDTIRLLADALESGDFTSFHQATAPLLREQSTPELFQESFDWLAAPDLGFDWTAVRDVPPVFDAPPEVDADGILHMTGHVPAGDRRLGFELQYLYETPMWMLISIQIRPPT